MDEELLKDAQRYRWLTGDIFGDRQEVLLAHLDTFIISKTEIDDYIDAAIADDLAHNPVPLSGDGDSA